MIAKIPRTERIKSLTSVLPPANEVWGKVMFLHLCVILFTGGGGLLTPGGAGQTPPDTSASGQYASYWNAFFFLFYLQLLYIAGY